jgi:hypothetical protein
MVAGAAVETFSVMRAFPWDIILEEIFMRPTIAVILACLTLAACGTSRRTVVVNPPPDSTTVVERDGTTTVIPNR